MSELHSKASSSQPRTAVTRCSPQFGHSNGSIPPLPLPNTQALKEKILAAALERDEARHQKESLEADAASQSSGLTAEVARLRLDVEVLKRDLTAALEEVRRVREERGREQAAEATKHVPQISDLPARVQSLEEEVARNMTDRTRLEGLLRDSLLKEREARRQLSTLQEERKRKCFMDDGPTLVNLTPRADTGVYAISEDEAEHRTDEPGQDELEFVYEDAFEMAEMMPFEKALQLAQRHSVGSVQRMPDEEEEEEHLEAGNAGDVSSVSDASVTADTGVPIAAPCVTDRDLAFEEPLRALEFALARLRGEALGAAGAGGETTSVGNMHVPATPGTGELADVNPFDAPLLELEQVLEQLGASLEQRVNEQAQADDAPANELNKPNCASVERVITPLRKDGGRMQPSLEESNLENLADADSYPLAMGPIGLNLISPYARLGQNAMLSRATSMPLL